MDTNKKALLILLLILGVLITIKAQQLYDNTPTDNDLIEIIGNSVQLNKPYWMVNFSVRNNNFYIESNKSNISAISSIALTYPDGEQEIFNPPFIDISTMGIQDKRFLDSPYPKNESNEIYWVGKAKDVKKGQNISINLYYNIYKHKEQ